MKKFILDACCASRMFWFNRKHPNTVFMDKRELNTELCDGRSLIISPDIVGDFRSMPFGDSTFKLVVFDPPHLLRVGQSSWLAKKYGKLDENWKDDIAKGFSECFRVLEPFGVLVFKWNEEQIPLNAVVKLAPIPPLFGNRHGKTHWLVFMKPSKG